MKLTLAKALSGIFLGLYPLLVWQGHEHLEARWMLQGLLLLLAVRQVIVACVSRRALVWQGVIVALLLLAAGLLQVLQPQIRLQDLKLYPALLDFGVMCVFLGSFYTRQPLVERLARWSYRGDFPMQGVRYTYRVNILWTVVMAVVTLVALYTAVATSTATWSLFNGLLVYVILGLTFGLEYAVRLRVKRSWEVLADGG